MPYSREKITLRNGLRILLDNRPWSESISITCLVKAGSELDFPEKDGLAHVVEHLLFRTKWSQKERSLFKAFENTGGEVNACTGIDRTVFSVYTYKDDAIQALKLASKIICDLPTDTKSLNLEKTVVAEELQIIGEDGILALQRNKYALLGGDESLKHFIGGTRKSVKSINLEDVKRFYEKYYVADNMVLSVVGNFNRDEIISEVNLLFDSMQPGSAEMKAHSLDASGPKLKTVSTSHNYMAIFFRCPSFRAKELAAVELINDILSSGTHSLLFQSLREQNALVYWIEGILALSADYGSLDIMTSTSRSKIYNVLTKIIDETSKLRSLLVSEDELKMVKNRLIKYQTLKFEDVREASQWYAEREVLSSRENADDFNEWSKEVQHISGEYLRDTAKKLFVPENCFVYVLGYLWPWQRWSLLRHIQKMVKQNL